MIDWTDYTGWSLVIGTFIFVFLFAAYLYRITVGIWPWDVH